MMASTKLIHAIANALIAEYGEEATDWLEDGGRANVERILAEWSAAIEEVLVLRARRHQAHWVEILGGPGPRLHTLYTVLFSPFSPAPPGVSPPPAPMSITLSRPFVPR